MGCVAYFEYLNKKRYLTDIITNRVNFAVGNILMNHERGRDIRPFMDFMESAFVIPSSRISAYQFTTLIQAFSLIQLVSRVR